MPPRGSGRSPEHKREELLLIVTVISHEFLEKKKRKRGNSFGPPRWPQLGLLGERATAGDPIYADADLATYGTFGDRLCVKLKTSINELREEQGYPKRVSEDGSLAKLLSGFKHVLPFEDTDAFAAFDMAAAWPEGEPEPRSLADQQRSGSENTSPNRTPVGRSPAEAAVRSPLGSCAASAAHAPFSATSSASTTSAPGSGCFPGTRGAEAMEYAVCVLTDSGVAGWERLGATLPAMALQSVLAGAIASSNSHDGVTATVAAALRACSVDARKSLLRSVAAATEPTKATGSATAEPRPAASPMPAAAATSATPMGPPPPRLPAHARQQQQQQQQQHPGGTLALVVALLDDLRQSEQLVLLDHLGQQLLVQPGSAHAERDSKLFRRLVYAQEHIEAFRSRDGRQQPNFVRSMLEAVGQEEKSRLPLLTMTTMAFYYGTRIFDDEHWGLSASNRKFDWRLEGGWYMEALESMQFIGTQRTMQFAHGPGFSNMVLQGLADAGDYRYSELSEQELRERIFFTFFPSARALRPRTAEQELKGVGTPAPLLAATAAVSTSTARKLNVMPVGVDFLTAQLSAISPPDYEGAVAAAGCGEAVAVTPRVVEERALEAARLEEEERVRKEEANAEKERERELERVRKEEEKAAKERERELERVRREEEKAAKEQSKEEERLRKAAEKEAERVAKGEAKEIEKLMKEMLKEVERRDKEETRMQKKRGNAAPAAAAEQGGARQVKRNKKR